ncbi:shikimate dehydrogenase [Fusobacterium simiae]|uniref:Shikimate dehydrogenase (NADP(+)) n=1 Tax=Fusobacterium simiae TaxID=855 RepID=A0ABT4DKA4_FUSSI|nr:shikimate dehydrogenase [Fusobacterium simiae]MCY7009007.1 shikimate dehydrogenase [Fusobacterium simiae]
MRKFGLLGKKLSHSLSPLLHNTFFEDFGIEAEYRLYEIAENRINNFKNYMLENCVEGVNITVPYKKIFLDKLDYISDEAKEIGAINLLYVKDSKFYGDNTDYYGFKYTLIKNQIDVKNKKIAIVGKGGASASVYKVLRDMGTTDITFYFRKDKLSKIEFPENMSGDIIINTTPVGMYPNIEDNLVNKEILKNFKIAIDLIYNPLETKFLKIARECGLITINGMDMLIEQALKTDEILYDIVLSTQFRKKIRKKIKKKVREFYENNGN